MLFFANSYDKQDREILGSDGARFIRAKSPKGAINKTKEMLWRKRATRINIFLIVNPNRIYSADSYMKIGELNSDEIQRMSF